MKELHDIINLIAEQSYRTHDCCGEESQELVCDADHLGELAKSAINNHDRLVAENESLKSVLTELMSTFALLAVDEGTCGASEYYDYCVAANLLCDLNEHN